MNWLLQLYPAAWRERYGEEFAVVLARQRASLGLVVDVLGGAMDARLHPQVPHSQSKQNKREDTMTSEMLERCAAGGPKLSRRDEWIAGTGMILASLMMSTAYVVLRKLYHARPAVEALGYMLLPFMLLSYTQMAYLRRRSAAVQGILIGGTLGTLYLIMWGACAIAETL